MNQESKVQVALVVCGRFHYHNYVEKLCRDGWLKQFVYSHKLSTKFDFGGRAKISNLWAKEYLYQGHQRLLGLSHIRKMAPLYHKVWEWQLRCVLDPAPMVHFLANGTSGCVIRERRGDFGVVVAEAVNTHPEHYFSLIADEEHSLGLPSTKLKHETERNIEDFRGADWILAPSTVVAKSFIERGFAPERIKVLPFGGHFAPAAASQHRADGKFKAVCVAQVTVRKGHRYLLEAWKRLNLPNAELHCYGVIDRLLLEKLQSIGAPNVVFHGPVSKEIVKQALAEASTFVLPTLEEGFAVSVLEAMSVGVPVITTEASGAADAMRHGVEGLIVPTRSVEALMQAIETVYRMKDKGFEMGKMAQVSVRDQFNWSCYSEELGNFYKEAFELGMPHDDTGRPPSVVHPQ